MLANIRDILIISTPDDRSKFQTLLGNGSQLGLNISYEIQPRPEGIAQAFIIGEKFIGDDSVCLILGDNIFYGQGFPEILKSAVNLDKGALICGHWVENPEQYGVIEFDNTGNILSIEEKPKKPKSNYAVAGIYFFDNNIVKIAKGITPSKRGELEIADVITEYLIKGNLTVEILEQEIVCFNVGTPDTLLEAGNFIKSREAQEGKKVGCIEETAYQMGFIDKEQLRRLAEPLLKNDYGQYLMQIVDE